ncbi:MAG: hypothetical protein AB4041_12415 [Microcystaceae cyanobacterium]
MALSFLVNAKENCVTDGTPLNTGIKVHPGQLLTISVCPEEQWCAGAGDRVGNANGLGNCLGKDFGIFQKGDFGFLYGSLIGTLDGGKTYFPVGTKMEMTVLNYGELSLVYWDGYENDNSDSIKVVVQIHQGPALEV